MTETTPNNLPLKKTHPDNGPGWPLEEHGYTCSSIRPMYFNHFLTYKIERAVYPGFDSDTRLLSPLYLVRRKR